MLPVLLLGLVAGYPNDVSLDDLKRFQITAAEVRDRIVVIRQYREFLLAKEPENGGFVKHAWAYRYLKEALDTHDSPRNRVSALMGLRRELGQEDYALGKLPPACPSKHERDLERWLKTVDVSLRDLPRFRVTSAEVRDRHALVRQFLEFMADGKTDRESWLEDFKSRDVYNALRGALDPTETTKDRLVYLISLQRELGRKDYAAGKLPRVCPAKYRRAFAQWRKDGEVSLDEVKRFAITDAALQSRFRVALRFRDFIIEHKAYTAEEVKLAYFFDRLKDARDTNRSPEERLSAPASVRRYLGKKDYEAGLLPPACPPKYEKAFDRWLADKKAWRKRKPNGVYEDPM